MEDFVVPHPQSKELPVSARYMEFSKTLQEALLPKALERD